MSYPFNSQKTWVDWHSLQQYMFSGYHTDTVVEPSYDIGQRMHPWIQRTIRHL